MDRLFWVCLSAAQDMGIGMALGLGLGAFIYFVGGTALSLK